MSEKQNVHELISDINFNTDFEVKISNKETGQVISQAGRKTQIQGVNHEQEGG